MIVSINVFKNRDFIDRTIYILKFSTECFSRNVLIILHEDIKIFNIHLKSLPYTYTNPRQNKFNTWSGMCNREKNFKKWDYSFFPFN